jgi:hypothetical protein
MSQVHANNAAREKQEEPEKECKPVSRLTLSGVPWTRQNEGTKMAKA